MTQAEGRKGTRTGTTSPSCSCVPCRNMGGAAARCQRKMKALMKINGQHQHETNGTAMRHAAKARSGAVVPHDAAAPAPAAPAATSISTAVPASVESTVDMAARKQPPGLVRVAARLEAMGIEGRTRGQSNALEQITRNLQRYIETQGLATPPAPSPDVPAVLPAMPGSSTGTVAPPAERSDGALEAIGAATNAPVETAGPAQV